MPPEHRLLLIDVDVALLVRREVGPVGWLVLEAIASLAPPDQAVVEVISSARSLSEMVGLSRATVARSLRSLIEVGIVTRVDHRHELSGRFLPTTYRVDLSAVGIGVLASQLPAPASSTSAPSALPLGTLPLSSASSADTSPTSGPSPRSSPTRLEGPSLTPVQRPESNHEAVTDLHPDAGPVPVRDFPDRTR
jgi:hypothetical protein